jgi:general secretion pathway protein J
LVRERRRPHNRDFHIEAIAPGASVNRRLQSSRGFTLVEILVALALMAMISTILLGSLQIGGHSWQRITQSAVDIGAIAHAQQFLRQRLSSLDPHMRHNERLPLLLARENYLEFSAPSPDSVALGMFRYQITVPARPGTLQVRWRLDSDDLVGKESDWNSEPLLPKVASMVVRFLARSDHTPGRWLDQWTDSTALPQLIRIDVTFLPKDNRRWPPLYIEPHVNTPAHCIFDAVGRRCRTDT